MTRPNSEKTILLSALTYHHRKGLILSMLFFSSFFVYDGLTTKSSLGIGFNYFKVIVGAAIFVQIIVGLTIDKFCGQKYIEFKDDSIVIKYSYFRDPTIYANGNITEVTQKGSKINLKLQSPQTTVVIPISEYWQLTRFKALFESSPGLKAVNKVGF